jgi:phosphate/sulfate permease
VADTIGGIVTVPPDVTVEVIGAGLAAAVTGNLVTWRLGPPSGSGHALVGGLVGAAVVEGGVHAINWGGIEDWRPVGVFGILIALALSPVLGGVAALLLIRAVRVVAHRATRRLAPAGGGRGVGDVGHPDCVVLGMLRRQMVAIDGVDAFARLAGGDAAAAAQAVRDAEHQGDATTPAASWRSPRRWPPRPTRGSSR